MKGIISAAAAGLTLALVGGCAPLLTPSVPSATEAGGSASVSTGVRPAGVSRAQRDLRATIMSTGPESAESITLQLGQPAYTAVFRIVPGQGAMMIYPRPGFGARDGYIFSGVHRLVTAGAGMPFVDALGGVMQSSTQMTGGFGPGVGPEYYFVVASSNPLRIDRAMYGSGSWYYPSSGGYPTMEWIVSQIVSDPAGTSWTSDYFVRWPEAIASSPEQGMVSLTCDGKRVWANPAQYERAVRVLCDGDGPASVPGGSPPTQSGIEPDQPDPAGVVTPRRRPPVAAATGRIASRQLEDPEGWEAARRDAATGTRPRVRSWLPPSTASGVQEPAGADPARRAPAAPRASTSADARSDAPAAAGRRRPVPGSATAAPVTQGALDADQRRPEAVPPTSPQSITVPTAIPVDPASPIGEVRTRPGLEPAAGDPSAGDWLGPVPPSLRPVPGQDPGSVRLRPSFDPMVPGVRDPGRIGPGYQFPIDPPTDPGMTPPAPAFGVEPVPVFNGQPEPSRREPVMPVKGAAPPPAQPTYEPVVSEPPVVQPTPPSGEDGGVDGSDGSGLPRRRPTL